MAATAVHSVTRVLRKETAMESHGKALLLLTTSTHYSLTYLLVSVATSTWGGSAKARLCVLGTWPDFTGYGFNLHAERGKPAASQFVGKVPLKTSLHLVGL